MKNNNEITTNLWAEIKYIFRLQPGLGKLKLMPK